MERFKGNVPYNIGGAEIRHLRDFTEKGTPVIVFPVKKAPFAALITRQFMTTQENNPGVVLYAGLKKGIIICGGGTTACDFSQLDKFSKLKDKF